MIDRSAESPVNSIKAIEDEAWDTCRFAMGIKLPRAEIKQVMNCPLRAHLARVGQWAAGFVTFGGVGYGIAMAPQDAKKMALGIVLAAFACVTAMGLKTYADREVPYGNDGRS